MSEIGKAFGRAEQIIFDKIEEIRRLHADNDRLLAENKWLYGQLVAQREAYRALCAKSVAGTKCELLADGRLLVCKAEPEVIYRRTETARLRAALSWIEEVEPLIVEAARAKFALAGKEEK